MPASTYPKVLALVLLSFAVSLSAAEKNEGPVAVSNGESFSIADFLVPGKTVIFAFVSDFSPPCPCEPCHNLGDPFKALHSSREDVVVIKVDIDREGVTKIDWDSPVAMQYGLRRLPHFIVYGPHGELMAQDDDRSDAADGRNLVHEMLVALPAHAEHQGS